MTDTAITIQETESAQTLNHSPAVSRIRFRLTRQGKFFFALLMIIFIGSMNFQNNLGMLTAVFVGYSFLISGFMAYKNLIGIHVSAGYVEPVFCAELITIPVKLEFSQQTPNTRLRIIISQDEQHVDEDVQAADGLYPIKLATQKRGRYTLKMITIASTHLLGAFEARLNVNVNLQYLVYPTPVLSIYSGYHASIEIDSQHALATEQTDYYGQRPYMPGDSIKHVNWKSFAGRKGLNTHLFSDASDQTSIIDWNAYVTPEPELRLSQMTQAIIDLAQTGKDYGLCLPGLSIKPGHGVLHRQQCLTAVTEFNADTWQA